jgi:hypothetical protein
LAESSEARPAVGSAGGWVGNWIEEAGVTAGVGGDNVAAADTSVTPGERGVGDLGVWSGAEAGPAAGGIAGRIAAFNSAGAEIAAIPFASVAVGVFATASALGGGAAGPPVVTESALAPAGTAVSGAGVAAAGVNAVSAGAVAAAGVDAVGVGAVGAVAAGVGPWGGAVGAASAGMPGTAAADVPAT